MSASLDQNKSNQIEQENLSFGSFARCNKPIAHTEAGGLDTELVAACLAAPKLDSQQPFLHLMSSFPIRPNGSVRYGKREARIRASQPRLAVLWSTGIVQFQLVASRVDFPLILTINGISHCSLLEMLGPEQFPWELKQTNWLLRQSVGPAFVFVLFFTLQFSDFASF